MAYLDDHPPVRDQWYARRNRPLTGCTVLHSTESVFDELGADTGAEGVAEFVRTRSTPGSYHDLVDSDSEIALVDYSHGAYHDGTGSNNWALSLAFACRTVDWNRMSPARRKAMLRNGARAFARQQEYRRSIGAPLTELRLITKAQSDAGVSGFTYHGYRDPDRRSDPGTKAPNLFPFDEFIAECRAVLGGEEDDMPLTDDDLNRIAERVLDRKVPRQGGVQGDTSLASAISWLDANLGGVAARINTGDPDALAAALREALGEQLAADVAARLTVTAG